MKLTSCKKIKSPKGDTTKMGWLIKFNYDAVTVSKVKEIDPSQRWYIPDSKCWWISEDSESKLSDIFVNFVELASVQGYTTSSKPDYEVNEIKVKDSDWDGKEEPENWRIEGEKKTSTIIQGLIDEAKDRDNRLNGIIGGLNFSNPLSDKKVQLLMKHNDDIKESREIAHRLVQLGYKECLYMDNGVKLRRCLGRDECYCCPPELIGKAQEYWDKEIMELPSGSVSTVDTIKEEVVPESEDIIETVDYV